jgi:hypothetical protein
MKAGENTAICQHCHAEFAKSKRKAIKNIYCSRKCAALHNASKIAAARPPESKRPPRPKRAVGIKASGTCKQCNQAFTREYHQKAATFCSRTCFSEFHRRESTTQCYQCGNDMRRTRNGMKYCSKSCQSEAAAIRIAVNCKECGVLYNTKPCLVDRKYFCSRACANAGKETWQKLIGQKFYRVAVKSFSHKDERGVWLNCECDCGNHFLRLSKKVKEKGMRSCGCWAREATSARTPEMMRNRLKNDDRTRWHITHKGRLLKFRSGFEFIYAQHLIENGTPFQFEPKWFCFTPKCRYCPDFYLPLTNEWIEVKGHQKQDQLEKHKLFRALGNKLTLLHENDIASLVPGGRSLSYFYKTMHPREAA